MKSECFVCVSRDHHFNVVLHHSQDPEVQKHATEILRKMLEQEEAELQVWVRCSSHVFCYVGLHDLSNDTKNNIELEAIII